MAIPSSSIVTLQPQLATFYEASFAQLSEGYIANRVFPVTSVPAQFGRFGVIALEELIKIAEDLERTPGAGYKTDISQLTDMGYATKEYGKQEAVDEREAAIYGDLLPAAEFAAMRAANAVLQAQEIRVAALLTDSAVYTGSLAQSLGNGAWSSANSTPLVDVENAVRKVYANSGLWPNTIIMSRETFRTLRQHASIISAITSTGAGDQARAADVTTQQLSQVFDLPNVIVAGGSKNGNGPSAAAAISQIWPKSVWIGRIAETQDMREACVGRTFHWSGDGSSPMGTLETYYNEGTRTSYVRVRHEVDNKRIYPEMGCMIASVIA